MTELLRIEVCRGPGGYTLCINDRTVDGPGIGPMTVVHSFTVRPERIPTPTPDATITSTVEREP